MNVLLVRPIDKNALEISPDLGLGYLATTLRREKYKVDILDCPKEKMVDFREFEKYIKNNNFDVFGFKLFDTDINSAVKSLKIIKKINPSSLIIAGGPFPSGSPEEAMKIDEIDYAIKGEAEKSFALLLKKLNTKEFKDVPGLIYRDDGIKVNNPVFFKDLDELGFPAWDLINPNDYNFAPHGIFTKNSPSAPILTTRGCPYQCTYCASKVISGIGLRFRSAKNVLEEIEILYRDYGVKDIVILDDNFTFNKKFVEEICNGLIDRKIKVSWSCPNGVRLDTLDKDLLKLMEKSGCYSLTVGVESGSPKILKHMKKCTTKEKIKEKVNLIRKETKIKITGNFIIGYPVETREDIEQTLRFSKELRLHRAWFGLFSPFPSTEIYNMLKSEGKLDKLNRSSFYGDRVSYIPQGLTDKDLKKFHKKAYLGFYLRPKILFGIALEIRSFKQIKTLFNRTLSMLSVK